MSFCACYCNDAKQQRLPCRHLWR
ncbi:MAG: hypothetical protein LBK08_06285 [Treponema sp.]|nr:hypothetical protein [Treponema sp.]